jgi:hypothetical protein
MEAVKVQVQVGWHRYLLGWKSACQIGAGDLEIGQCLHGLPLYGERSCTSVTRIAGSEPQSSLKA